MRSPALGKAVTRLPWLSPCAAALAALAREPDALPWADLRHDPGAVLLLVRQAPAAHDLSTPPVIPQSPLDPAIFDSAARLLDGAGFVDWDLPAPRPIYVAALGFARAARALAARTGQCDPDNAWVAGMLAPLGWMAACAVDGDTAAACLGDPHFVDDPGKTQERLWGIDHAGLARRLARRWGLPRWLAAVAGHLELPAETAQAVGANAGIFRIVQLAVSLAQQYQNILHIGVGGAAPRLARELGLNNHDLLDIDKSAVNWFEARSVFPQWVAPRQAPLLRDLLKIAADKRRLVVAPMVARLEGDVDRLHRALHEQVTGEEDRLGTLKLNALAEFAGGAGHEINNPLAVISGQAQYLLHHEVEPARQRSLQAIIGQAQRIHLILQELMQFARPPRPKKQVVEAGTLIREVTATLADLARERCVQIVPGATDQTALCYVDPGQARSALMCLARNAIEAAPADGWTAVRWEAPVAEAVNFVVEDTGPGPAAPQREHLFDPFYSGRQAGRGRGLGLPTAWRLARENGGDVRWVETLAGPTRFVLTLPRATAAQLLEAQERNVENGIKGAASVSLANGHADLPLLIEVNHLSPIAPSIPADTFNPRSDSPEGNLSASASDSHYTDQRNGGAI